MANKYSLVLDLLQESFVKCCTLQLIVKLFQRPETLGFFEGKYT